MYMLSQIIYILSVAFQLSAGIILLLNNINTNKTNVVEKYYNNTRFYGECTSEDEQKISSILKEAYLNRCAFCMLIIGYGSSVFGDKGNLCNLFALIAIIFFAVIIMLVCQYISDRISKKDTILSKYKKEIQEHPSKGTVDIQ